MDIFHNTWTMIATFQKVDMFDNDTNSHTIHGRSTKVNGKSRNHRNFQCDLILALFIEDNFIGGNKLIVKMIFVLQIVKKIVNMYLLMFLFSL